MTDLSSMLFSITSFRNQTDNEPKPNSVSWEAFTRRLTPKRPSVVSSGSDRAAWSPASYPAGVTRKNANVLAVSMLVADVDDGTEPDRLLHLFQGNACLVHTSWSHMREKRGKTHARCRLVVPFCTPVPVGQWEKVWKAAAFAASKAGITFDSAVDSPSEIYFLPALRDADQPWWFGLIDGDPLDWTQLEPAPAELKAHSAPALPLVPGSITERRILGLVKLKCSEVAQAESRHEALLSSARYIGGLCARYNVDPERFVPDLVAAAGDSTDALRTCQDGLRYGMDAPVDLPPDSPAASNRSANSAPPEWLDRLRAGVASGNLAPVFGDQEVLANITRPGNAAGDVASLLLELPHQVKNELRRAGKELVKAERAQRKERVSRDLPLIVQHGRTWWCLDSDRYFSVEDRLAAVELNRIHKLDTTVVGENSSRWMNPVEVYDQYGVTAVDVRWTYGSEGPAWDARERLLDVPGARVREGVAEYSPEVDAWLQCFVKQSQTSRMLDWLATAHLLDRPTSSPQFRGPSSAGKAMLVAGLATWLGGSCEYAAATGDFNACLISGPVVVLDEGVAESKPDAFRQITGKREHNVCAKFRNPEMLRGCPRVIITSNESDPLRLGKEELSLDSENALGKRILVFDVQEAAVEYLERLGGWSATSEWAGSEGALVRHLRWLAETREVAHGSRFLVQGDSEEWIATAHLREGVAKNLIQAFEAYRDLIEDGRTGEISGGQPFYFNYGEGLVGINVRGLQDHWKMLVGDTRVPTTNKLSDILKRLSGQDKPVRPKTDGERLPRVYLVPISSISGD